MPVPHFLAAAFLALAAVQQAPADSVQTTAQEEPADTAQVTPEPVQDEPGQVVVETPQLPPVVVQSNVQPYSSDPRIQLIPYDPNRIVTLGVAQGFASVVDLAGDERVENLVVGNSAAWQVTANKRGDRVIVKPLPGASQTNMVILTASRRYVFVLDPFGQTSFVMRFSYPQPVQAMAAAAGPETTYKLRGAKTLYPLAMFDDGHRTVIRWSAGHPLPAIFAVNGTQERLVNGRMVGDDMVVEGASPRYKFRYGRAEATAIRQTPKRR